MIIIALVRSSGLRTHKAVLDVQWNIFWNEVEATVATFMVSVTAFRQLLGIKARRRREKRDRSWYSYHRKLLFGNSKKRSKNEWDTAQLPSIPGARLTGLRTLIRGGQDSKSTTLMTGEDHRMILSHDELGGEEQNIQITQEVSVESEAVRYNQQPCLITFTDIDPIRYQGRTLRISYRTKAGRNTNP